MTVSRKVALVHVDMKARWAQEHFNLLESEIAKWIKLPPYTVTHEDDLQHLLQVWRVEIGITPESIPKHLGDWVCCLRSALDRLAWEMAHVLAPTRIFSEREERNISFLIFKDDNSAYRERRSLFPSAVADMFDKIQPYVRKAAYRDHLLWQLNELWNMDKHRTVPISDSSMTIHFPIKGWEGFMHDFDYGFEVHFPLGMAWKSPVNLKPNITFEVTFGEPQGMFSIPLDRLREINEFVRNDVIPLFASFFPESPNPD